MHRIMLREVIIDAPATDVEAVTRFWSGALAATPHPIPGEPFTALRDAASLPHVATQDIGDDPTPRYHLDIETDDLEAEIARLEGLGATVRTRHADYAVMVDPVGLPFCLLPPVSAEFETRAKTV
ncbi:VOC family protein [Cellulomonas humilata]|uniref:VOC family protein n=1 Tax=Cellulomonas humilata TaxID=144055 RepID=A0A7Y6A2G4_9CELL|nr:VOC family protein [Cellulomonas humilata]NUU18536.1 VOC family protein [Cellulomonas humilata]